MAADAQSTFTQRLQKSKAGEGKVTVVQDKAIDDLINGPKIETRTTTNTATSQNKQDTDTSSLGTEPTTPAQRPIITQHQLPDTTATSDETIRKKVIKGGYKINGYRVQVFAGGNSRDARIKAERTGREMNSLFPGEPVYVHFYSPRWICRMGNYRTYEEAHQTLNAVKKLGYSSAIIVKGKITVSSLPATETSAPSNP